MYFLYLLRHSGELCLPVTGEGSARWQSNDTSHHRSEAKGIKPIVKICAADGYISNFVAPLPAEAAYSSMSSSTQDILSHLDLRNTFGALFIGVSFAAV